MSKPKESLGSPFIDRLSQSIADIHEDQQDPFLLRLLEITNLLIEDETDEITIFHGGPLDHHFRQNSPWIYGVEVRGENNEATNFHITCFNCDLDNLSGAKVVVNLSPEYERKLNAASPEAQELKEILETDFTEPVVLIRPSLTGSLAYPLITTPADFPEIATVETRLKKLLKKLNLEFDTDQLDWSAITRQQPEFMVEGEYFIMNEPIVVENEEIGTIYLYQVFSKEDKWLYYELVTCSPISFPLSSKMTTENIQVRVDSGCDSGMLYHDGGCDCHAQLLDALRIIKNNGGIVVHCPTQDGRGYGFNTKMETEAHKRGITSIFNADDPKPTGTIAVAKNLFGNKYDIRDFESIGRLLAEIGFRNITLITDNKDKVNQVLTGGRKINKFMTVDRQPTFTIENGNCETCLPHIEEKHHDDLYFD